LRGTRLSSLLLALAPVLAGEASGNHRSGDRSFSLGFSSGGFSAFLGVPAPAGHYALRPTRVWVPGWTESVYVPAKFEYRRLHGCLVRVLREPAHYETVVHPGYYKIGYARVWVPACRGY
jgi:hypothetical protein